MTRLLFPVIAIVLVMTVAACDSDNNFVGSDNIISEIRDVAAFTDVEMSDAITADISFGTEQSITVRANENLLERINTTVSNGKLSIDLQNGNYRNVDLVITIVMPDLQDLKVRDACRATATGFQNGTNLTLEVSDASSLTVTNTAVVNLTADVMDASNVAAFGLSADEVTVNVQDASSLDITANNTLTGRVRGASTVRYHGNPTESIEVSDASSVVNAN